MAKVLTDVDTYTASVTVPEDGDTRNAASIETAFQALANRTKNSKGRLDGLDTSIAAIELLAGDFASFALSGTPSASGLVTLVESTDPNSRFSAASDEITLPALGWYEMSIQADALTADATDPIKLQLTVQYGSTPIINVGGYRPSATNIATWLSGTAHYEATSLANLISVKNTSAVAVTVNAGARLLIRRLS